MATNISLLPQLSVSFVVINNADWRDSIQFYQTGTTTALDLTGISFKAQLRSSISNPVAILTASTDNGLLINGGMNGLLSFAVPRDPAGSLGGMSLIPAGSYVLDLIASGDSKIINLFQAIGPATVLVKTGVTK